MSFIEIILIAISLAMDAFAVSLASGVALKKCCVRNALRIALSFGFFQAVMPVIGWLAGLTLKSYIEKWDHWVAVSLLTAIGLKMIFESGSLTTDRERPNPLEFGTLMMLSVATSLDALAVGLSLGILQTQLWFPILIIGLVTFSMSFAGVYLGGRIGQLAEKYMERIAGIMLIGIGIRILIGHLM